MYVSVTIHEKIFWTCTSRGSIGLGIMLRRQLVSSLEILKRMLRTRNRFRGTLNLAENGLPELSVFELFHIFKHITLKLSNY